MNIELTDLSGSLVLPTLAPPLVTDTIEGATDIQTLDNNLSTYFTANKRLWTHTWPYLEEDEYNSIKGFYDRQWTDYRYPLLSIAHFGVANVPVRMTITGQQTIDKCGRVENVMVTFRETRQI